MNGRAARACRTLATNSQPETYEQFRKLYKSAKDFYYSILKSQKYKNKKINLNYERRSMPSS